MWVWEVTKSLAPATIQCLSIFIVCVHVSFTTGGTLCLVTFFINWASEASPTLGCSIEISHDIYVSVGRYVCRVQSA